MPFQFFLLIAFCTKAASFLSKTTGEDRVFLLTESNEVLKSAGIADLPSIAEVHWLGDRDWHLPPIKIDTRIQNSFKAGDNSIALRRSVAELLGNSYPNYAHRFTDGSLSRLGVGIGVNGDIRSISLSLPEQCSVFSAEAAAAYIAATTPSNRPILVLTDSVSVISALKSNRPTHPWIQGILKYAPKDIVFAWIPGHCGIPGNEAADRLAGSGYTKKRYTKRVPLMDIKNGSKTAFINTGEICGPVLELLFYGK